MGVWKLSVECKGGGDAGRKRKEIGKEKKRQLIINCPHVAISSAEAAPICSASVMLGQGASRWRLQRCLRLFWSYFCPRGGRRRKPIEMAEGPPWELTQNFYYRGTRMCPNSNTWRWKAKRKIHRFFSLALGGIESNTQNGCRRVFCSPSFRNFCKKSSRCSGMFGNCSSNRRSIFGGRDS